MTPSISDLTTPGPWQALPEECHRAYIRIRGVRLGSRYKIANVLQPCHDHMPEREAAETRANAALIQAAPDLLAALRAIMEDVDVHNRGGWAKAMKMAEAAIARATTDITETS